MKINVTDTCITLEEGIEIFPLLEKPEYPDYTNVTPRPHFIYYYTKSETIWDRFCFCMEKLPEFCPNDPYLGCYALIFRHLYTLLLSSNQAKNIIAYGAPTDCGAYRIFQDFMTFLQEDNALTALAQTPFSFTALTEASCLALLYRLDTCPALTAVCDAMEKVKPGGLILLYTLGDTMPTALSLIDEKAHKDHFGSCTVYTLHMDEALSSFVQANNSKNFIFSYAGEILKNAKDLYNLIQTILDKKPCTEKTCTASSILLQNTEEALLSIYDYLENDELPILANALKEAVLNYHAGVCGGFDLTTYRERLTQASHLFFSSMKKEFQDSL